jgi:hypothetical protein
MLLSFLGFLYFAFRVCFFYPHFELHFFLFLCHFFCNATSTLDFLAPSSNGIMRH